MRSDKTLWEAHLQRIAIILWAISIFLGLSAVLWRITDCVAVEARIGEIEKATAALVAENGRTNAELERLNATVTRIVGEIQEAVKTRKDIELNMAEVLARAKMLEAERGKFRNLREQIERRLAKMDEYYMRSKEASGR